MKTINLPTGKKCKVIEINDLDQINTTFLKDRVDLTDRYTCLHYKGKVNHFAMILSKEFSSKEILEEIRQNLKTDIFILEQLNA